MSPAEKPFLDAILAHYQDDGPRLVYADFLDETGDPADTAKAELIRVQVALAKLPPDHPRRSQLANREHELTQATSLPDFAALPLRRIRRPKWPFDPDPWS